MTTRAAAYAAAMAQAIKASGALVRLQPEDFVRLLNKQEEPLVVVARGALFRPRWQYLMPYKGLVFFTGSPEPVPLPGRAEIIEARRIWVPN
jgi:hypothetical protein